MNLNPKNPELKFITYLPSKLDLNLKIDLKMFNSNNAKSKVVEPFRIPTFTRSINQTCQPVNQEGGHDLAVSPPQPESLPGSPVIQQKSKKNFVSEKLVKKVEKKLEKFEKILINNTKFTYKKLIMISLAKTPFSRAEISG